MCFERVSIPCLVGDTSWSVLRHNQIGGRGIIFGKVSIRVESGMTLTKGVGSGFERVITHREIL